MTITQLIDKLTKVRNKYGDIEVVSYNEPFLRHSADAPEETRPVALQVKDAYPDGRICHDDDDQFGARNDLKGVRTVLVL